jgi:hypothetical protein
MQNVAAWRMFESVHENAISKCSDLECHNIGTCEMWARAEGTGNILINATGGCAT